MTHVVVVLYKQLWLHTHTINLALAGSILADPIDLSFGLALVLNIRIYNIAGKFVANGLFLIVHELPLLAMH